MNSRLYWTFAITSLALFAFTLDRLVVAIALPAIRTDLGAQAALTAQAPRGSRRSHRRRRTRRPARSRPEAATLAHSVNAAPYRILRAEGAIH
jgi:hypothetical protein